ncbi:MAG: putative molybdenum carrier protein [Bacteroidota bacterium]
MSIEKIISGGQTGVDQAALQAAIDSGIEHGGWCPPGRVCEDGIIPNRFRLKETPEARSPEAPNIPRSLRTEWNIRDAEASLIILPERMPPDPGTSWALKMAEKYQKPYFMVDPTTDVLQFTKDWIRSNQIRVLGVGGPSEMTVPGIYDSTYQFMKDLLTK